jgi:hypothetical protein
VGGRRGATVATLAALAAAAGATPAHAADASPSRPLVAIAYYSSSTLKTIKNALVDAKLAEGTPIYYGNYWGTSRTRKPGDHRPPHPPAPEVHIPNGRAAPIFGWTPNKFWTGRRLTSYEQGRIKHDNRRVRGRAPGLYTLIARGGSSAYSWGRELGRRFRDRMRQVEKHGDDVASWQFDEVSTNALGRNGHRSRYLVRGMLDGVTYGRPELGDKKMRGIVYFANATLELANEPYRGELKRFWRTVDRDSLALAGEEYPRFVGNPRRSAFVQANGQRAMARRKGSLGSLASKYVSAVTPGYLGERGLGGNVHGRSTEGVNAWRADYLHARAQFGIAGYATYDLLGTNWYRKSVRPLFRAFAAGLRMLGAR